MIWSQEERPEKERARRYLFGLTKFVATSTLWLPAAECYDLKLAFQLGLLDRNSRIIAVESDPEVYCAMCRTLEQLAVEQSLAIPPVTYHAPLHEVTLDHPIDFAFIDLCGTCDASVLSWMQDTLASKVLPGADLAVTCVYTKRNSKFLQDCRDTLLARWGSMYRTFCDRHAYFDRQNDTRDFEPLIVPAVLLKCAFHRHDVFLRRPWPYADDMPMIAYKLQDLKPAPDEQLYPSFTDVLQAVEDRKSPQLLKPRVVVLRPRPAPDQKPKAPVLVLPKPAEPVAERPVVAPAIVEPDEVMAEETVIVMEPSTGGSLSLFERRSIAAKKAHATRRRNNWVHPRTLAKLSALS